ncbi:winged helix-turn-helix domain-containing protein [Enterococcus ureasiticus]|uniref:OmpR/PhoB-type domain-containing protein n=1 Tax=Enterococcus ureasiticus TaxID=903984 RepID=A0A1E5GHH9_9ENTE|nr:winged helix-turn-helix domain-containing protein [Enterococcus ureasiticus]OEG12117.1 hypothetical protein BCR21_07725 [Enterococcus ureasiticus]
MYKIGYLPLSTATEKEYATGLEQVFEDVKTLEQSRMNFEEISQLDAIVIQDDENHFVEDVCELLVYLRNNARTLIWIVSEQLPKINRKIYSKLGIDGFACKESEPDELASLLLNGLKRMNAKPKSKKQESGVALDSNNLNIVVNGQAIWLTKSEFLLTELLYKNMNNVVTYEEIRQHLWAESVGNQQYRITNLVFLLRQKMRVSPIDVMTVRSKGYMLTI